MRGLRRDISVAALTFVLLAAFVASGDAIVMVAPIAVVQATSHGLEWQPRVEFERMVLTVAQPDGTTVRQEVGPEEVPRLDLFTPDGQPRPEGLYVWELRVKPRMAAESMAEPAEAGSGKGRSSTPAVGERLRRDRIQSGTFAVLSGTVFLPGESTVEGTTVATGEPPALSSAVSGAEHFGLKQILNDDLIVQGRVCAGFDCTGGEIFGEDVLRLKENSLVLKLEDTSTALGFPTNDWRLRSNAPSSGGPEQFSIEDADGGTAPFTLQAGAPDDALRVDALGRVGLGTAAPGAALHVVRGDGPALRLEQDGTLGEPLQSWELVGDEAGLFVRDVTNGSTVPFRVAVTAPASSLEITDTGRLGVGTASPAFTIHVLGSDGTTRMRVEEVAATNAPRNLLDIKNNGPSYFVMRDVGVGGKNWQLGNLSSSALGGFVITRQGSGVNEVIVKDNGDVFINNGTVQVTSSRAAKENFEALDPRNVLDSLSRLPVTAWNYKKDDASVRHVGPTSEDFQLAFSLGSDAQHLSPTDVSGVTLVAVQGLQQVIEEKERRIGSLEERLRRLEEILEAHGESCAGKEATGTAGPGERP